MTRARVRTVLAAWAACAACAVGCGGAAAEGSARALQKPPAERAPEPEPAPPVEPEPMPSSAPVEPPAPGGVAPLPGTVQGSDIPRPQLLGVLSAGVGRFLQHVRAEATLDHGRFVGWRLVKLFDADLQSAPPDAVLRPGDVVTRVNGQSIERPEQFKNVWDSLATASELVLNIERDGAKSELRYRIVE